MNLRIVLVLLIALASASAAHATRLYKWVDREGNVSYHDRPPPADAGYRVEEKRFGAGGAIYDQPSEKAAEQFPVVLYSAAKCGPCDSARAYLKARGVPFTEKNVEGNPQLQQELIKRAGGLAVPTITVGDKVMRGYLESLLEGELDQAGYPKAEAAQPDEAGEESEDSESLEPLEPPPLS